MRHLNVWSLLLLSGLAFLPAQYGCGSPSKANIQLRKEKAALQDQIDTLNRRHAADQADLHTAREAASQPSQPISLPPEQLAKLFTVHGIQLGRMTGADDLQNGGKKTKGLKVFVVPTDDDGQPLKAAGTFDVELFDLAQAAGRRIGHWHFDTIQSRGDWYGQAMLYTYVLPCPWSGKPPAHSELTVHVTFRDELTGRVFDAQRVIHFDPASSQPSAD